MRALRILFGLILIFNFTNPGYVVALAWVTAIFALVGGAIQIYQVFKQRADYFPEPASRSYLNDR